MESLQQKILDAARDEVARTTETESEIEFEMQVAMKAMEKQAGFFRWASIEGWSFVPFDKNNSWVSSDPSLPKRTTELELYEIWEGQKK